MSSKFKSDARLAQATSQTSSEEDGMTILLKPFYFIRHGETDFNRLGLCTGSSDIPLNQKGLEQAEVAAKWLLKEQIEQIVTSPLSRAKKTAEIISAVLQKPITVVDDLKECCWGDREGQPKSDDGFFHRWLNGQPPIGAETVHEFEERVSRGLWKALELTGPVLMVAHAGVYSVIARALGFPNSRAKNCSPYYHRPPEHKGHPWFINDLGDKVAIYDEIF
jgi:probable phosphoglycerate mutase